jgi:hypothetical protein
LAAIVWHIGGFVLLLKSVSLFAEAGSLRPEQNWQWIVVVAGLLLGMLKARFLFSKFWYKNSARIDALEQPRLWQFFRPRFFLMLALMILAGAMMSRLATGYYRPLIGVALLDLSLAIALLGSGLIFWRQRVFVAYASNRR